MGIERKYTVEIVETSREFTAKEKVMLKDISKAQSLNELSKDNDFIFKPSDWAILKIHNEMSENKDYTVYVIFDTDGNAFTTSSENFFDTFLDIVGDMQGVTEEWAISVYQLDSKKRSGSKFLTCSII